MEDKIGNNDQNNEQDNGNKRKGLAVIQLIALFLFVFTGISYLNGHKTRTVTDGENAEITIDESQVALADKIDDKTAGSKTDDAKTDDVKPDNAKTDDAVKDGQAVGSSEYGSEKDGSPAVSEKGTALSAEDGAVLGTARNAAELQTQIDALNNVQKKIVSAIASDNESDNEKTTGNAGNDAQGNISSGNDGNDNASQTEADRIAAEKAAEEAAKEAERHIAQVKKYQDLITALKNELANVKGDSRKKVEITKELEGASEKFKTEVTAANKSLEEAKQAVADMAGTSAAGMKAVQELAAGSTNESVIARYFSEKNVGKELDSTGMNWAIGGYGNNTVKKGEGANAEVIAIVDKDQAASGAAQSQNVSINGKLTTDNNDKDTPESAYKAVKTGNGICSVIWCPDYDAAGIGDEVDVYVLSSNGQSVQKGKIKKVEGNTSLILCGKMDESKNIKLDKDGNGNPITINIAELKNVSAEAYDASKDLIGSDDVETAKKAVEAAVNNEIKETLTKLAAENNSTVEEEAKKLGVSIETQTSEQSLDQTSAEPTVQAVQALLAATETSIPAAENAPAATETSVPAAVEKAVTETAPTAAEASVPAATETATEAVQTSVPAVTDTAVADTTPVDEQPAGEQ